MSEPQQPPVPPYGQPSPQPQAAPQPPLTQPFSQQQPPPYPPQPQPQQPQPYAPQQQQPQYSPQPYPQQQPPYPQQQPPSLAGAPQGYPPAAAPYSPAAQQAAQQYPAAPGYPASGDPAYAPRPAASGQALGRTALIVALITFGIGLVTTFLFPVLYGTLGFSYGFFNGITSFLVIVGSGIALTLGLIAIRRPGSPILAGIAIGIAASEIAASAFSWFSMLFYSFV